MNPDLARTAFKLKTDLDKVCAAFDASEGVIDNTIKHYEGTWLQIHTSIEFGLWADLKFSGDWKKFEEFVRASVDAYEGRSGIDEPGDKSQLWVWKTPDKEDPISDVDRILDRIDVALHLLSKELEIKLPVKTVRDHGFEQKAHLRRLASFVEGLNDVLDPDGKLKIAAQY